LLLRAAKGQRNHLSHNPLPILLMARQLTQGGSERQLTEIAKALDRSLFDPHVAVLREGGFRAGELRAAGIPVINLGVKSFFGASAVRGAWRICRYLRRHRIRIAHSFDVPGNIFLTPVARAAGVPLVLTSQRAFRTLLPRGSLRMLRWTDRLTGGIVVNCRAIEAHLIVDEKVPAPMVHLCCNGLDVGAFSRLSGVTHPELARAGLVVGVVCALRPEKDLPTLVRGFALARRRFPGLHLVIVGSGAMLDPLQKLCDELGIAEFCTFRPSTSEVREWLSAIDIFVLPSATEALSNSLMEAMACECVPVASDVGGNPELVIPGERGLLFAPGSAEELASRLETLAADSELRKRYAAAACCFIRDSLTIEQSAKRMSEIYLQLIARNRKPR